ncbi:16174_t:CDS:2 [Dentiscutata erythropus]|uniref:16174_t:CDS:1 n=1 Tax=Dentiscutata erythropus TaxID=1348616 RepID=A0A9N9BHD8_9GLOM|nr:16174_t:CDS:2 [Dentiscutata erythropus]
MPLYIFVFGAEADGLYANPDDCNSFIECSDGQPYVIPCPEDTQWSSRALSCDWQENSDCEVYKLLST